VQASENFKLTQIERSEAEIQRDILRLLKVHPKVAWAQRFNVGAQRIESKSGTRFIRYAFKGCADILGQMTDGRFLAVEVKSRKGKATPEQEAFLALVGSFGGVSVIARCEDDVLAVMS